MDFPTIMVLLVAVTGGIWALDAALSRLDAKLRRARPA